MRCFVLCSTVNKPFPHANFRAQETKPAIWEPSFTSSPGSTEELGGCVSGPLATFAISNGKQGISSEQ